MAKKSRSRGSWDGVNDAILRGIDVRSEYESLGVEFASDSPNSKGKGFLACYARAPRDDGHQEQNPSAAVNLNTGRYIDKGGSGESLSLFDFAAKYGSHADWKEARRFYATKAGVDVGRGRPPKSVDEQLEWAPWSDHLVRLWAVKKLGANGLPEAESWLEVIKAFGCRLAHYPKKSGKHVCIAMPSYGPHGLESPPTGWVLWNANGGDLPVYSKKGPPTSVKMKTLGGSKSGLVGFHALAHLEEGNPNLVVWKVEGPTDALALMRIIPPEFRNTHLVLCNSCGATEDVDPAWARSLAGLNVQLIGDADTPGEAGAAKWLTSLHGLAAKVRQVRLPYEVVAKKGKDLRDWIAEQRTAGIFDPYAALIELARSQPAYDGAAARPSSGTSAELHRAEELGCEADCPEPTQLPRAPKSTDGGDSLFEQRLVDALQLDVLGEMPNGSVLVFAAHADRRREFEIKDPDRLSYARLLQIAGQPAKELVSESGEEGESWDGFTMPQVRNSISYLAGKRRLGDQTMAGIGCWQAIDDDGGEYPAVIVVGAGEAAKWNGSGKLERVFKPRIGGRLLGISSSDPWYDYDKLAHYVEHCNSEWSNEVISETIELFAKWRWQNDAVCPTLMTGLVLATWVQTLWAWRPQVAITGASNAGKSTLFKAIAEIFGGLAVASSKSSAAGIRQVIQTSGKVILCDEFENSKHRPEVLEMVRAASRGDKILMGTTSHKGKEFVIRHIIWVAAIEVGLKRAPDKNRFALLELVKPPAEDFGKLVLPSSAALAELGQKLLAIAIRYVGDAKQMAVRLKARKHPGVDNRIIESYGVPASILAAAFGWDDTMADGLLATLLTGVEEQDRKADDSVDLLHRILRAVVRFNRIEERTVAQLLGSRGGEQDEALGRNGIAITMGPKRGPRPKGERPVDLMHECLFIDTTGVAEKLLKGTKWEDQSLDQILKTAPGACLASRRVGGKLADGVEIPMQYIAEKFLGRQPEEIEAFQW